MPIYAYIGLYIYIYIYIYILCIMVYRSTWLGNTYHNFC